MASIDRAVLDMLAKHEIPGAAVAVVYQKRLVYARGFGLADRDSRERVQPDSLFRIASLSKPITGLALLRLVDQGKVKLDDRPFANQLRNLPLPRNGVKVAAWDQVTVRQLLQHTAGMPTNDGSDPMFLPNLYTVANAYGTPNPPTMAQIVGHALTRAPVSAPGARYSYSNVGLGAVGTLIQAVTGKTYEAFVKEEVLAPLGITRMALGATLLGGKKPGEVRYHTPIGSPTVPSAFLFGGSADAPYGGFSMEALEGSGGWIASPIEYLRLLTRFYENNFLSPESLSELFRPPALPVATPTSQQFYSLGVLVQLMSQNRRFVYHSGSLPGTTSYFQNTFFAGSEDLAYAFVFNMRKDGTDSFTGEAGAAINLAIKTLPASAFPAHDLWETYFPRTDPQFSAAGVVSAASFRSGSVAPGQIITIFGDRLGGATLTTAVVENNRLTSTLNGTRVLFDGVAAPLVYASAKQVSAIVPYSVTGRSTSKITVEYQGSASLAAELPVVAANPSVFTANSSGVGPAAAIRYPEARIAVLFATGEGLLTPLPQDGALSNSSPIPAPRLPVKVFVDGREAKVLYAGAAPNLTAGLLQINIEIPEEATSLAAPTLIVEVGGVRSQTGVTLW